MIYKDSVFSSPSIFDKCLERTIISNGFSKAFAMTGWRLGAVIGPPSVIEKMRLLLETTSSCVPPFIQKAGIEAIEGEQTSQKNMYVEYEKRRDLIVNGINSIPELTCVAPGGAFYVFVNIKKTGMTSETFCEYVLEDSGVAMLPGTSFGQFGEGFIRICYAVGQNEIKDALERIKKSICKLNL
jgi:aspartate/methionine/tyrosine aminotransferase